MTASTGRDGKDPVAVATSVPDPRPFPGKAIAVALALAWVAILSILAVTQANPVTLNRDQILRAEVIVSARIDDVAEGACTVEQQWKDGESLSAITVSNLHETAAGSGRTFILPLQRNPAGAFEVVAAPLPDRPYLVYPATDEVLQQLRQQLEQP